MSNVADPFTGADIVGELLRADDDLAAIVPAERIKLGAMPDGTPLPLILIRCISSVVRDGLMPGNASPTTDRVAVLVRARDYREQRRLVQMTRSICHGKRGGFDTGRNFSVRTAGAGPDMRGPPDSFDQNQDFRVFYNA